MNLKTIVLTAVVSIAGSAVGAGTAHAHSDGQASDFRLINTSSASAAGGRLLWASNNNPDPHMCWQVFQSCQFFCGYNEVFIPDHNHPCALACWDDYMSCLGWN